MILLFFEKLHVWSLSPLGQIRTLANYFFYRLFAEVFHEEVFPVEGGGRSLLLKGVVVAPGLTSANATPVVINSEPLPLSSVPISSTKGRLVHFYYPLWVFLYRSALVTSVRARQDEYFRTWKPLDRTNVVGIVRYSSEYAVLGTVNSEEEDPEAIEASELPESALPSGATVADPSNLSSYGSSLSAQDLLLSVRRITSKHLHDVQEMRERSYFDDSLVPPSEPTSTSSTTNHVHAHSAELESESMRVNFQQKIAPVKAQFVEETSEGALDPSVAANPAAPVSDLESTKTRLAPGSHLILCASLVSKPVNLGGLCRTAEIMTARLILSDAKLLMDQHFVAVSSTANRWADIEIVAVEALVAYLLRMKAEGYALIGLEQTIHSTPLQSTSFPSRVVLVLGDEKRGIPPNILQVLTHVVEIPQFGLIRSLNVHVSAGMIVWEWIKQNIADREGGAGDRQAGSLLAKK
jgi:tRNA guanosine-2'-O-methyltransferase